MKTGLFLFLIMFTASCIESQSNLKPVEQNCKTKIYSELLEFLSLDSLGEKTNLNQCEIQSIYTNGEIVHLSLKQAMDSICEFQKNYFEKEPIIRFSISENYTLVFASEKGLWGPIWMYLLIDSNSQKIIKVKCDHKGEAPLEVVDFKNENYTKHYENVYLDSLKNFKLDGITGATETHSAYTRIYNRVTHLYSTKI